MRLAPLIPLAILALLAALIDTLVPQHSGPPSRDFRIDITDAIGTGVDQTLDLRFDARQLSFNPTGITARDIQGTLLLPAGTHNFSATSLREDPHTKKFVLSGAIKFWRAGELVTTTSATVDRDGTIVGDQVQAQLRGNTVAADAFTLTSAGKFLLHGSVRAQLAAP